MPSQELTFLKTILRADVFQCPGGTSHGVTLKEMQAGAKLKKVEVLHLGNDSLVIFPDIGQDRTGSYSPLFDTSVPHSHNKGCDAVILCTFKDRHYRIFCELKSDRPQGVAEQFLGSECFMDYLNAIVKKACRHTPVNRQDRRVVFNTQKQTCQTLDKRPVSYRNYPPPSERIEFIQVRNEDQIGIGKLVRPTQS